MPYNTSDTTANVRCTPCARVVPAADRVAHDLVAHYGIEHTGRYAQVPDETFFTVGDGEAIEVELIEDRVHEADVRTVATGTEWTTFNPLGSTATEALANAGLLA